MPSALDGCGGINRPGSGSDLAGDGAVFGKGIAQWRFVEAPPITAEVVVVRVIQDFTGQRLESAEAQRRRFLTLARACRTPDLPPTARISMNLSVPGASLSNRANCLLLLINVGVGHGQYS